MVVANFDDEFWLERAPLRRSLGRPSARTARRIAGKAFSDKPFEFFRQRRLFLSFDRGCEADVVQQPLVIIEAEQERADNLMAVDLVAGVTKAAHHAIGAAEFLDLLHPVAI